MSNATFSVFIENIFKIFSIFFQKVPNVTNPFYQYCNQTSFKKIFKDIALTKETKSISMVGDFFYDKCVKYIIRVYTGNVFSNINMFCFSPPSLRAILFK